MAMDETKQVVHSDPSNDAFLNSSSETQPSLTSTRKYPPYFLANFLYIVQSVLHEDEYDNLFTEKELQMVSAFTKLHEDHQKLFIRLFLRKRGWLTKSGMKYEESMTQYSLDDCLHTLCETNFLTTNQSHTWSLEELLSRLNAHDLHQLAKEYKLSSKSNSLKRADIITKLIQLAHRPRDISSFFTKSSSSQTPVTSVREKLQHRLMSLLPNSFKVADMPHRVFQRIGLLFLVFHSATSSSAQLSTRDFEDYMRKRISQLVFELLQVSRGAVRYPKYEVNRVTRLFPDREYFLRYEEAYRIMTELDLHLQNKRWDECAPLYEELMKMNPLEDETLIPPVDLPSFLLPSTPLWCHVHSLGHCATWLETRRDYQTAAELLERLVTHEVVRRTLRSKTLGQWYHRLCVDLGHVRAAPLRLMELIHRVLYTKECGSGTLLADPERYLLYQRAVKLKEKWLKANESAAVSRQKKRRRKNPPSTVDLIVLDESDEEEAPEFPEWNLLQAVEVHVQGQRLPGFSANGTSGILSRPRYVWIDEGSSGGGEHAPDGTGGATYEIGGVESCALQHYAVHGFPVGLHGETSTVLTPVMLLLYDIVFDRAVAPDAFHSRHQMAPLDMRTPHIFYQRRRSRFEERLNWLTSSSEEELVEKLKTSWKDLENVVCLGLAMDLFQSVENLIDMVLCLGRPLLVALCERFATRITECTSGFPDLVVWNSATRIAKIVEVKGPGDRLSHKQEVWIDWLIRSGADVELCKVKVRALDN